MMGFLAAWVLAVWELLTESALFVLFGLAIGGFLKVFLSPSTVVRHLGEGRFRSVFKASLLGMPMPLCSCGVLPAAVALRKQGANRGATTAFMISTPETGVDSVAITYALLGPVMAIARPVAAFMTATVAGLLENLIERPSAASRVPDLTCVIDGCCDGEDCPDETHRRHHSFWAKLRAGLGFAFGSLWADLANWFLFGMALAGLIAVLVPDDALGQYLGGGWLSMFLMLLVGIPLYICATASTPIAASLLLKGVSPGAALVFLLAGPATNVTSLSVLLGVLGKRATVIYLSSIATVSVLCGWALDMLLGAGGLSPRAYVEAAGETFPPWAEAAGAVVLLMLSVPHLVRKVRSFAGRAPGDDCCESHQCDGGKGEESCDHRS